MAFDLKEAVDRAYLRYSPAASEAEAGVWKRKAAFTIDDVMNRVGRLVAKLPAERHRLQTIFTIPTSAGVGSCSLGDDAAGKSPADLKILTGTIYQVDFQHTTDGLLLGRRAAGSDELRRPLPLGYLWWTVQDDAIYTVAPDGSSRYTAGGSTLVGDFLVRANYIPTINSFPQNEALQPYVVSELEAFLRGQTDARFAATLLAELRAG